VTEKHGESNVAVLQLLFAMYQKWEILKFLPKE
jgi:hypothetical protein